MSETKELLASVEEAIKTVAQGGQSYKIGSRSLTRANITELRKLRKELQQEIASEESGASFIGNTYAAFFDGR